MPAPEGAARAERSVDAVFAALALLPTALATLVLFWLVARAGSRFVATSVSRRIRVKSMRVGSTMSPTFTGALTRCQSTQNMPTVKASM